MTSLSDVERSEDRSELVEKIFEIAGCIGLDRRFSEMETDRLEGLLASRDQPCGAPKSAATPIITSLERVDAHR